MGLPATTRKNKPLLLFSLITLVLAAIAILRYTGALTALSVSQLASKDSVLKIQSATGEWEIPKKTAYYNNKDLKIPNTAPHTAERGLNVLSSVSGQEKWIEIDLSSQRLRAWEGDRVIYDFIVSTGTRWTPTPTGEYRIWIKLRYHSMEGGSRAWGNYYYLPNVPFVMYFYKGYGIHGTYWHNNFGTPTSHGCVNLRTPDAEKLFWWAQPTYQPGSWATRPTDNDPGTRIVIHE